MCRKVDIPTFTIVVVTIAAILFIRREVVVIAASVGGVLAGFYLNDQLRLHKTTGEEIKVSFELWWNDGPAERVAEGIKRTVVMPEEIKQHVAAGGQAHFDVSSAVNDFRNMAFHLAIHAQMDSQEQKLLDSMPRIYGIRSKAKEQRAEHGKDLDKTRLELVQVGLDVDKMEAYFAPSTNVA